MTFLVVTTAAIVVSIIAYRMSRQLSQEQLVRKAASLVPEKSVAVLPFENLSHDSENAFDGPAPIEILARVAAQVGEPDRAIAALQKVLAIPYEGPLGGGQCPLTPALLRLDPMFDPLRDDPRFQRLAAWPAPK